MKEMPQSSLRQYQKIGARSWRLEAKSLYPPTPPLLVSMKTKHLAIPSIHG